MARDVSLPGKLARVLRDTCRLRFNSFSCLTLRRSAAAPVRRAAERTQDLGRSLGTQLVIQSMVAAGDAQEQPGLAHDGLRDRVIGRGVARMKGQDDVGFRSKGTDAAAREREALDVQAFGALDT